MQPAFDDWSWLIVGKNLVRDHGFFGAMHHGLTTTVGAFWRPLNLYPQIWGAYSLESANIGRLLSIIIYAITFYFTARSLFLSRCVAFFLSGILLFHPSLVVVAAELDFWGDAVLSSALLLTFLVCIQYIEGRFTDGQFLTLILVCSVIAVLSKESGVIIWVIPFTCLIAFWNSIMYHQKKNFIYSQIFTSAVISLYLLMRFNLGLHLSPSGVYPKNWTVRCVALDGELGVVLL